MKLAASLGLLVVVSVVGLGLRAVAFQSDKNVGTVIENVENFVNNPAQEEALGASASPDSPFSWESVGGVRRFYGSMAMNTATTTVCAIQSPAVTSTLTYFSAVWDVSSSTASTVTLAQAANAFATTTQLGVNHSIAADAQSILVASSTALSANNILAPSQFVVIGMKGGSGTFSPVGYCKAEFTSAY